MSANPKTMKTLCGIAMALAVALTAVSVTPTASAWCTAPNYVGAGHEPVATVNVADCQYDCYVEVLNARTDTPCANALP